MLVEEFGLEELGVVYGESRERRRYDGCLKVSDMNLVIINTKVIFSTLHPVSIMLIF